MEKRCLFCLMLSAFVVLLIAYFGFEDKMCFCLARFSQFLLLSSTTENESFSLFSFV